MPNLLLDKDTAGPQEWVTAMQPTLVHDFTRYPRIGIIVSLVEVTGGAGTAGARQFVLPDVQVQSPTQMSFRIPDVGPNDPRKVPEGRYQVTIRLGMAAVLNCDPILRVRIARAYVIPGGVTLRTFTRHALQLTLGAVANAAAPVMYQLTAAGRAGVGAAHQAQSRVQSFWGGSTPSGTPDTVELLIDGMANMPAIDELCRTAEHFIYFAFLALDEDTRLTTGSQTGPSANAWHLERVLKDALTRRPEGALDVKVLVWEPPAGVVGGILIDMDLYATYFTDLGDLTQTRVRWGSVRGANFSEFRRRVTQVSGAAINFLNEFRDRWYRNASDNDDVYLPSGVHVAVEKHPNLTGSHHQKFVLTDRGLWVGGLNFQKHYWDATEHYMGDMRRASSGEAGHQPVAPNVMPWHDVGAVVRGKIAADAGPSFENRWNAAIRNQSAVVPLINLVQSAFPDLARRLESFKPRVSGLVLQQMQPTSGRGTVVESAAILETLPPGTGWARFLVNHTASAPPPPRGQILGRFRALLAFRAAVSRLAHQLFAPLQPASAPNALHFAAQNLEAYMEAIERMDEPFRADDRKFSFIYLENQYFTHLEITEALLERWKQNVQASGPDLIEEWRPFAFIVIPYVPQPSIDTPLPTTLPFIATAEMALLKWLELRTARKIMLRTLDGGLEWWCDVPVPQDHIKISGGAHDDPEQLSAGTQFTVVDGYKLDPQTGQRTGERIQNESKAAEDVLTVSDIMAFTLTATHADNTVPQPIPYPAGTPRRREKDFLIANHVYCHAKVAFFHNDRGNTFIGTVGSANLNARSLGGWDARAARVNAAVDSPDSEMNVWFKGRQATTQFRDELWTHHLKGAPTIERWLEQADENLRKILRGSGTLEGHVVRLDVVARKKNV